MILLHLLLLRGLLVRLLHLLVVVSRHRHPFQYLLYLLLLVVVSRHRHPFHILWAAGL
jgi:hypothetical protein